MDQIRLELDQLMGKDRNWPLHIRLQKRDHFDDEGVCKFNLLGFCTDDFFPNTKHDTGRCQLRHDHFLKVQFMNDPNKEEYARKYESELIDHLQRMVNQVDMKIKMQIARAENPIQGSNRLEREQIEQAHQLQAKLLEQRGQGVKATQNLNKKNAPEMSQFQKDQLVDQIERIEMKIELYANTAIQHGEDGNIEEMDKINDEVEKLRKQKQDLHKILEGGIQQGSNPEKEPEVQAQNTQMNSGKPDRNNTVCEVCGAMQSNADTDSRMQMHLEGKLHIGYEKIRDKLKHLKEKRADDRRRGYDRHSRPSHRSRSRSNDRLKRAADEKLKQEAQLYFYYSSTKYGMGSNMPKLSMLGD